jgi:hypothetical protein
MAKSIESWIFGANNSDIWSIGRMKPVIETEDQKAKLVLLKPGVSHESMHLVKAFELTSRHGHFNGNRTEFHQRAQYIPHSSYP